MFHHFNDTLVMLRYSYVPLFYSMLYNLMFPLLLLQYSILHCFNVVLFGVALLNIVLFNVGLC